jgi:hypothetical protein
MVGAKKLISLMVFLVAAGVIYGATLIPDSSILPARLEMTLSSKDSKPGEVITTRIMQNVPLPGTFKLPAGSKLTGQVISVQPASGDTGGSITFRLDTLHLAHEAAHLILRLRAAASYLEVRQAELPRNGDQSGPGTATTTVQIGGDTVYRGGGPVRNRSGVTGKPVDGGVLVRLDANPGRGCRNDGTGERAQALWLFSSDACGTYGLEDVSIVQPVKNSTGAANGEITLKAAKGNVMLHDGSGFLLRVDNPSVPD